MEFKKNILVKIANKEKLFDIVTDTVDESKPKRKKRKTHVEKEENLENNDCENEILGENKEEKEEDLKENKIEAREEDIEKIVIKPKFVRTKSGLNPKRDLKINNIYNVHKNNSEDKQNVENFSHQLKIDKVVEIITENKEEILPKNEIKRIYT
jgi:hypothetical protein